MSRTPHACAVWRGRHITNRFKEYNDSLMRRMRIYAIAMALEPSRRESAARGAPLRTRAAAAEDIQHASRGQHQMPSRAQHGGKITCGASVDRGALPERAVRRCCSPAAYRLPDCAMFAPIQVRQAHGTSSAEAIRARHAAFPASSIASSPPTCCSSQYTLYAMHRQRLCAISMREHDVPWHDARRARGVQAHVGEAPLLRAAQ